MRDVQSELRQAVDALPAGLRDHVRRVGEEARRLADPYGLDEGRLELAVLGHDLARALSGEELLRAAEGFGLHPNKIERAEPILLHGAVSAAIMAAEYGVGDEEILAAVRHHTLGRAGMGLLEKLLFLADKIEVGKVDEEPALAEVRDLARRDLDAAVLRYLDLHLLWAVERGWPLHPDVVAARNDLLLRRSGRP